MAVKTGTVDILGRWPSLFMHNANVVFMVGELLLGRLPVVPEHAIFAVLFGAAYIIFSWAWFATVGVFYYFFLDYLHSTVFVVISHIGMLTVFCSYYMLCCWLVSLKGEHHSLNVLLLVIATACILRFQS
jgi:hypothetical protein